MKHYIVTNKEQELDILKKLEQDGIKWYSGETPTKWLPSTFHPFPIFLEADDYITWGSLDNLTDGDVVFDGRTKGRKDD